ncbi:hypothetical protein [Azovibrio restrictus]|uniref:hypothetical protein n=1 Tax=Azovibrio restrictus TaxID=146938 RepID=UPI0026EB46A6|nr:hypothetical protein [Azovibrio restrictus]
MKNAGCWGHGWPGRALFRPRADSTNGLRLSMELKSKRGEPGSASGMSLSIEAHQEPGPEAPAAASPGQA